MLAVVRADDESLVPPQAAGLALSVARPPPTETASLGFGGSPVGGGDKNSRVIFFTFLCVGGYHLPSGCCGCVGITPRGVYFGRKTAFSEWVLCADGHAVPSCTQRFFGTSVWGGITTLGVRFMLSKRWTPAGHGGLFAVFMPPQCSPCVGRISTAGTHATPTPNRAHSGSHAETRRVLRVDGDDVLGSGIIDTIDPFQADQTVAVALAEGHRNTVSP